MRWTSFSSCLAWKICTGALESVEEIKKSNKSIRNNVPLDITCKHYPNTKTQQSRQRRKSEWILWTEHDLFKVFSFHVTRKKKTWLFFKVLKLLRSFRIAFELFSREKINFCVELYSRRPFHFIPIYSTLETKRLTTLSISPRLPQFPIDIDLKTIHHIVMTHNTAISIFNICAR